MARLAIRSLGALHITLDDAPLTTFDSDKARALLAYLAIESQHAHRRECLAGLFWPEYPEDHARHTLSQVLSNVRQVIGDRRADQTAPFLDVTRQTLRFNRNSDYWLDVDLFAVLPRANTHQTLGYCEQAVAVYRGHFLEGLFIHDSPAFDEWLLMQRERWQRKVIETLSRLVEGYTHLRDYDKALHYAWQQLDLDPWREDAHRQAMRLLALSGQRSAALAQYEICRRMLADALDTQPETETVALYHAIKTGRIAAPHSSVHVPQTPDTTTPPHNLPAPLTPLVGRHAELASLHSRLQKSGCRLLTLVGPGGIGKTRLALEAAASLVPNFAAGVFLVSLAPLQSASAIVPTIAQTLGFAFSDTGAPQEQQLLAYLKNKTLLLLLDNAEHLLRERETERGTTSTTMVDLIVRILEAAPGVKIMVTSRTHLNILGEYLFPVHALAYPEKASGSLADIQHLSAVQLFVQSTRQRRPDFALTAHNVQAVSEVCRYVEGIPLAILLIAAWTTTLSTTDIAAKLTSAPTSQGRSLDLLQADWHNVPPRHRSLRAVFEHSWRLLARHEREIFQALSVFRGGFTQVAARAVARATPQDLHALVNASFLIRESSGRYAIHELLRQYAAEKLEQTPTNHAEVNDRHCAYYTTALQRWGNDLLGARQRIALSELDTEIDNARAAWEWATANRQITWLEQGLDGWGRYLRWRAYHAEGLALFETKLERLYSDLEQKHPVILARLLTWAGIFNQMAGQFPQAAERLQRTLTLYDLSASTSRAASLGKARALIELAHHIRPTDPERAITIGQEGIALYRAHEAKTELAKALYVMGEILGYAGHVAVAIQYQEESLRIRREVRDYRGIADSLRLISYIETNVGNLQRAEQLARESCQIREDIGDVPGMVISLYTLGTALFGLGRFAESIDALSQSVQLSRQLGFYDGLVEPVIHLSLAYILDGQFDATQRSIEGVLQTTTLTQNPRGTGYAFFVLGFLATARQEYARAQEWLMKSIALFQGHSGGGEVEMTRTWLALTLWMQGERAEARAQCITILEAYIQQNVAPFTVRITTLTIMVLVCLDTGMYEKAIELYAFAHIFPMLANISWLDNIMREPLVNATASMPPKVVAAAQTRGRKRDLQATIEELLEVLAESRIATTISCVSLLS
ncbi:MAG: hypothetical protein JXR84_27715 [Anaerolineae bacterium]|nr:hypothetical protein [Anaerolineae bacterium]